MRDERSASKYRADYNNNPPSVVSFALLLLVRLGGYIVNLSDFYSYRLIGKLTVFFQFQEFSLRKQIVESSTTAARLFLLCSNLGLEIFSPRLQLYVLNLDGAPIISKSHSPITLANISSINLVSIFRYSSSSSNPVYVRHVHSSSLGFSLSSHRQSCIGLVFISRFIDS